MKKRNKIFSLITLILALAFPLFADASTTEFKQSDVKPGTYIVGTHMFTNDGEALTIEMIMLAAGTILGEGEKPTLDDMKIYYKDFNNNWVSGSNGEDMTIEENQIFEIEYIDDREVKGTITGSGYNHAEDDEETIIVTGDLEWAAADDTKQNGRLAGNYTKGITITAPEGYTKEFLLENATVKFSDRDYDMSWKDVTLAEGEETHFTYWSRFIPGGPKLHTITIKWEQGNVQVFTVKLADDGVTFADSPKGSIYGAGYVVDNTITLTGTASWKNHDGDLQNGRLAGNYISGVRFEAPEGYTREYLIDHATVKFSDRDYTMTWEEVTFEDEDTFFVYWPRFIKDEIEGHTVTVTWEEGNVQEFTINLQEGIVLVDGPSGTIGGHGADYAVEGNTITIKGDLEFNEAADIQNGRNAGYYSKGIKFTAPEDYEHQDLLAKTKVFLGDREFDWNGVVKYEEEGANYFIYWPRFEQEEDGVKEHTVTIEWEPGNVQVFNIKLGEVEFVGMPEDS